MARERPGLLSRRAFLRFAGAATAATAAGPVLEPASVLAGEESGTRLAHLAEEHGDDPGMLIDLSRCIGCGACVAACKLQNGLEFRTEQPTLGPEAELASESWTVVKTVQAEPSGPGTTRFVKQQCLHCLEPACASVCWVKALQKSPEGPVTYSADRCIGCRYCMMACPFGVPTFQWEKPLPLISKCSLCFGRVAQGGSTACAAACPAGAIGFGRRRELIQRAWERVSSDPKYVRHVYGETEAGGTSVLYVSDVPFEDLGFRAGVPSEPLPDYTWKITRTLPGAIVGLAAVLGGLLHVKKRMARQEAEGEGGSGSSGGEAIGEARREEGS